MGMRRNDLVVLGAAVLAAGGAIVLLDTAVLSVPTPALVPATMVPALAVAVPEVLPGTISGVYESEGRQVALPPGNWVVMQRVVSPSGPMVGDARASVVSTTLLRRRGRRVDAALLVQVNAAEAPSSWGLASGCQRKDFYFARVRFVSDHDSACSYVTYVTPWSPSAPEMDPSWRISMQQAVDNGWGVPVRWLAAVYRLTDPVDALQVRYLFDPLQGGAAEAESPTVQAARLVGWSEASWPSVHGSFRGRLKPGGSPPLTDWASFQAPEEPAETAAPGGGGLAAVKTLSYQVIGSVADFAVAYAYLGNLAAATALAVATSVAGSALYYAHEVTWSYFSDPAAGYFDLPGTGLEQAAPVHFTGLASGGAAAPP